MLSRIPETRRDGDHECIADVAAAASAVLIGALVDRKRMQLTRPDEHQRERSLELALHDGMLLATDGE